MKRLTQLFAFALIATLSLMGCEKSDEPTSKPFEIYTLEDLITFRDSVNIRREAFLDAILMADIDLQGEEWTPIGTDASIYYSGTFDGNNFTISSLSITEYTDFYLGFIGYAKNASIKNLTIKESAIDVTYSKTFSTGIFAGYADESLTITNCNIEGGSIKCTTYTPVTDTSSIYYQNHVGGLLGYAKSGCKVDISTCHNDAAVTSWSSGLSVSGGFVAYAGTNCEINISYSSCSANVAATSDKYHGVCGGFVGYANNNCTINFEQADFLGEYFSLSANTSLGFQGEYIGYQYSEESDSAASRALFVVEEF